MARPYTLEDVQRVIANSNQISESKKAAQLKVTEPRPYTVEDVERVIARNKERATQQKPVTGELWERAPKSSTEIPYVKEQIQKTSNESTEIPYVKENISSSKSVEPIQQKVPSLSTQDMTDGDIVLSLQNYAKKGYLLTDEEKTRLKEIDALIAKATTEAGTTYADKVVLPGGTELSESDKKAYLKYRLGLDTGENIKEGAGAFVKNALYSFPGAKTVVKAVDKYIDPLLGTNLADAEGLRAEIERLNESHKAASALGSVGGNLAGYYMGSQIANAIPAVANVTGQAADTVANALTGGKMSQSAVQAGASHLRNAFGDMTLDVALDTVPTLTEMSMNGASGADVAKTATENTLQNFYWNMLGESAPMFLGETWDKVKNMNIAKQLEAIPVVRDGEKALAQAMDSTKQIQTQQVDDVVEQIVESTKASSPEYLSGSDFFLEDIVKTAQRNPDIPKSVLPSNSKFAKADKDMSKLVKWYGDDNTVKFLEDFRNSLLKFESSGSLEDFNGMEEALTQIENAIKGKTYTSPNILNKNGTLKRKGVTYTYGDAGSIDDVLDEMMDAVEEVYITKKVADNISATKGAYQVPNVQAPGVTSETVLELTPKDNIANSSSNVNAELDPLNAFGLKGEDITSSTETAEDLWRQLEAGDITKNTNQQSVQNSYGSETGLDPLNSQGKLKEESYSRNIFKGRVENVSPEIQNTFINEPSVYQTLSNAETMQRAQQIYDSGRAKDEIYRMLDVKDPASIPLGNKVMSDLIDEGKSDEAVELLRTMSSKLRESGQFTQAAAITMMKSDPDTALRYAVREIDSLNTAGRKKYGGRWKDFALTDDEIKAFQSIQRGDTDAIKKAYEQIGSRLAKEYPSTKWEKVVELSRIGMLLNWRTQIRNVVSNAILQPVRSLSDRVSALGQNAIHLINPDFKVTQSLIGGGKEEKKIAGEVWDSVKDSLLEDTARWDNLKGIGREKQVFSGSPISKVFDKIFPGAIERANKAMGKNVDDSLLETVRNFTYYLLERGDEPFVKNNFVSRLSSYMKAQGIKGLDEIPEEAITLAKDEALKATFKDDNGFTRALTGIKQNTGKLGEVIMPFTKTPANLAMRGIDYSPAGLVSTFKSAKNGSDAAKIMDDLSKNLVGSAAIFGGYELAKHGIITGKLSSDKDEAAFQKQQGQLPYSIRVGDNYYTYDWAQPAAIPFILGASIYQSVEESDREESDILKSLKAVGNAAYDGTTAAVNAWAELSPLQSFQDLFSGSYGSEGFAENLANEILEYPQRLWPAVFGATARTMDTTQRQTYSAGNPIQTQIDTAISKIPVLSETLPAAYDTWGNEIKRSDSIGEAAFAQMINPGQLGRDASTWLDSEIQRLYDSTESSTVFPQKSAWTVDGHKLSNREYSDLQREQGSLSYDIVEKLIASDAYDSMEDSARVETIADIYALTKALAENSVVGKEIPKTQQKTAKVYEDQGVEGVINYMMFKSTADTDGNGSINQDEARTVLDSSGLTNLQKAYYWKLFNSGWKNNPYE